MEEVETGEAAAPEEGGPLTAARLEIAVRRRQHVLGRERERRLRLSIRLIDQLLDELENLNLARRRYVAPYLQPLVDRLEELGEVPGELMRPRMRIHTLMDRLFDAQEDLLRRKGGAFRQAAQSEDDPPDAA